MNPGLLTPTTVRDIFRGLAINVMKEKNSQVIS